MPTIMRERSARSDSRLRPLAATLLCLLLPGQTFAQPTLPAAGKTSALKAEERELHVLNRFTFGPTPDDLTSIHALGIDAWFEQQLNPDRIAVTPGDQELSAHLADLPALQLPVDQLLARFPSNAETRQAANGKLAIPDDPVLAAIYRRHIALYEDKQAKKAEAKPADSSPATIETPPKPTNGGSLNSMTTVPPAAAATGTDMAMAKPADPARPAYSDAQFKSLLALPPAKRLNRVLNMQPAEYETFHSSLKPPQRLQLTQDLSPYQKEILADYENPTRAVIEELQSQRLLRDIYSSHQLQEVMTTFWLNHFNVFLHKNDETPYYLVSYERDVIRPRALGNFENLLVATAESPAMLLYLDNSSSTGPDSLVAQRQKQRAAAGKAAKATPPGLNENYARELMELHTLGVNGGYTQKDVTEVAKVFTGWTVDKPQLGGGFHFDESRHQPGKKLVLGAKIKEDGQREGLQLLHTLATSPATAHFISQELAINFVSDTPSKALVDRMAQAFLRTHGDIPSVLRAMLHSPEFWAPEAFQAKVKTPLEYVVSAARASHADITNTQPLMNVLNQMGMPLYGCVPPTGWSDKADAWVSTGALVTRMNFGLSLATNRFPGIQTKWTDDTASPAPAAPDPTTEEHRLEARLIPTGITEKTRSAILAQVQEPAEPANHPPANLPVAAPQPGKPANRPAPAASTKPAVSPQTPQEKQDSTLAGLLIGSPEFQRR